MTDFDAPTLDEDNRARIGGNNPPSPIELAQETFDALSKFLADHPAIVDEISAREAKLFKDRAEASKKDVEDDRARKADPVYARWKAIREPYTAPLDRLDKLIGQLKSRMTAFALAEEARRKREAAEASRIAEEARQAALAAEAAEREAIDNAAVGDLEADVGQAVAAADDAFAKAKRAHDAARIAERDSHVRIGGGFSGRVASLKTTWVYSVAHGADAFAALWPNDDLQDALVKAARAFEKRTGNLPAGITKREERKI